LSVFCNLLHGFRLRGNVFHRKSRLPVSSRRQPASGYKFSTVGICITSLWNRAAMPSRYPFRAGKRPPLTVDKILASADEFQKQHGRWPTRNDGTVPGELTLTWNAVDNALIKGFHGLPGGDTLAQLLAAQRGHRHHFYSPRLTIKQILKWADAHFQRTGQWPKKDSGALIEAPGETWSGIDAALYVGGRGLRGQMSLAILLAKYRGRRNAGALPLMTVELILKWAEAHHTLFGEWPSVNTGPIGNTGETWLRVDSALRMGLRGLPGGSSLCSLLKEAGKFTGTRVPRRRSRW
jgi:hypothetical protein